MKILKPGKVKLRKFVCAACGCEFTAFKLLDVRDGDCVACPQDGCYHMLRWDNGEPYEEPTQTDSRQKLIFLIKNFRATNLETADCEADFLIANGVTFRGGE